MTFQKHGKDAYSNITMSAAEVMNRSAAPAGERVFKPLPRWSIYRNGGKRTLELFYLLLAAPAVILVVALLAVAVATDGKNPFYSQLRVGRGGKIFRMWKLRSMVPNADALLEGYLDANPAARAEWDRHQKLTNDPRVTRVGKFIRKTSMDELPQLFNVLLGDMAIVGPRPMMVNQQSLYRGSAYYRLRPGLTGPWQVSARHESAFEERVVFDQQYERDCSLRTDLALILRTARVVTCGTGQ